MLTRYLYTLSSTVRLTARIDLQYRINCTANFSLLEPKVTYKAHSENIFEGAARVTLLSLVRKAQGTLQDSYRSKRTLKLHLVALPPFVDVASADATLCGWPIDTVAGRLLGSSPAGAHKCLRCGSESVWQAASAVAAHLAHESDSD